MTKPKWEVLDLGCDDETRQAATSAMSFTSLYEVVKLAYLQPTAHYSTTKHVSLTSIHTAHNT